MRQETEVSRVCLLSTNYISQNTRNSETAIVARQHVNYIESRTGISHKPLLFKVQALSLVNVSPKFLIVGHYNLLFYFFKSAVVQKHMVLVKWSNELSFTIFMTPTLRRSDGSVILEEFYWSVLAPCVTLQEPDFMTPNQKLLYV